MSEIKNRIITISGEPASGKSTVIKRLKEEYEKQGYNVHIFSVGNEFRKMAQEKGLSIEEFNKFIVGREDIDRLIDSAVAQRGKEINSKKRLSDIYIFDSRLAFHNIPNSFSIRLTVDDNVAGKRVFEDKKRGEEDKYSTLEDAIKATRARKLNEVERYKNRYGIDLQDPNNYKLVIDTSFANIEDIAQVIMQGLEYDMQDKFFGNMWTSPKKLLPLQDELDTIYTGSCYNLNTLVDIIKKEGYDPTREIFTIEVDDRMYIIEGHHRNFAAGSLGKTLVPYLTIAKDDETMPIGFSVTARERARSLTKTRLLGHEQFFDQPGKPFSYDEVYPGIKKELIQREGVDR